MVAAPDPRPKVMAVPEHDQFRDPLSVRGIVTSWHNTSLVVVPGADHFLIGRTDRVVDLALDLLKGLA